MNITQADINKLCSAPKRTLSCPSCQATVTSWHEEDLIDQHGHCAGCEVDGDKAVVCPVVFPSVHYTAWKVQPGVLVLGEAVALTVRVAL